MSYMRSGWPLKYFKGITKSYVFKGGYINDKKEEENYIEDYSDAYKDNASFIELLGRFVYRVTDSEEYEEKIVRKLAKKLGVEHKLREKKLAFEEYCKEQDRIMEEFQNNNKRLFGDEKIKTSERSTRPRDEAVSQRRLYR